MNGLFVHDPFDRVWPDFDPAERFEAAMAACGAYASSHAMSDGSEGLLDALMAHGTIELHGFDVSGPDGSAVFATAGRRSGTWWIDTSELNGPTPSPQSVAPLGDSRGIGELIGAASRRHPGPMAVGLSNANAVDGGLGALMALGLTASDSMGRTLHLTDGVAELKHVRSIHGSVGHTLGLFRVLANAQVPLEAAALYRGAEFGMNQREIEEHTDSLRRWTDTLNEWRTQQGHSPLHPALPGGGAGGGLGFALAAVGGTITDGARQFGTATRLPNAIESASAVVFATPHLSALPPKRGSASFVIETARKHGKPVYALVGQSDPNCSLSPDHLVTLQDSSDRGFERAVQQLHTAIMDSAR